ncbi:autotransporter domain-containing protein [Pontiella sp.]|uniref:autotransporter family protein n=1 Tax=Pontiella sp. TaxID=2837462 RepID=UPI003564D163
MKKLILTLAVALVAGGVLGQSEPIVTAGGTTVSKGNTLYRLGRGGTVQRYAQAGSSQFYDGGNIWLRDDSWSFNSTLNDGETDIQRGNEDVVEWWINNVITAGRIFEMSTHNNGTLYYMEDETYVYSFDDPEVSSLTGNSSGRSNSRQRVADNAVTIKNTRSNTGLNATTGAVLADVQGSWHFYEGNYWGGTGYGGLVMRRAGHLYCYGTSFVAGDETGTGNAANGASIYQNWGDIHISNRTDVATDRFQAATYTSSGTITRGGDYNGSASYIGGNALTVEGSVPEIRQNNVYISGGDFYASQEADNVTRSVYYNAFDTYGATVDTRGGTGAQIIDVTGSVNIGGGNYIGGPAASITIGGAYAYGVSQGGGGIGIYTSGTVSISNSTFTAGKSASTYTIAQGLWDPETQTQLTAIDDFSSAYAAGGSGIYLYGNGAATISDVKADATAGSVASVSASNGTAIANGGYGLYAYNNTVTINSGTFNGGKGGIVKTSGYGEAYGGAGVLASGGTLTINGGTFTGGAGGTVNGVTQIGDVGVWVKNTATTISEASASDPTVINGHLVVNNQTGNTKALKLLGGSIGGDIYSIGSGTTTLSVSTNATYSGAFIQQAGTMNVVLSNEQEAKFFTDVYVEEGSLNFQSQRVVTKEGSSFVLDDATLNFQQGAILSKGTTIDAGYGTVKVGTTTAHSLDVGQNSVVMTQYDSRTGDQGLLDVAGTLYLTNQNSFVALGGVASKPNGYVDVVKVPTVVTNGTLDSHVKTDLGWLTKKGATELVGGYVRANYQYKSLTESELLMDIDNDLLTEVDAMISDTNVTSETQFYNLNSGGEARGEKIFRYSLTQLPDAPEATFQLGQQVNQQLSARGSEFRTMNGFASNTPQFDSAFQPQGAAGPVNKSDEERTLQGWVRAYGSFGDRNATGKFSAYDMGSWGSVIGVDKNFGNLLVGLAGGFARTDIDAGDSYDASIESYHGSIYATVGGERVFVDLAGTYAWAETEEQSIAIDKSKFDSDIYSAYIGTGIRFDLKETVSITPEASFLASFYNQESFDRQSSVMNTQEISDYSTESYLGSLGVSIATIHQLDWLNQGVAFIPELRGHWLHEFNADQDDFSYQTQVSDGSYKTYSFGVRAREEDLFLLGCGFDIWSWKHQNSKFEIDYDGVYSSDYHEHIFSGKVTYRF